jgi:hypothetical protein
MSTRGELSISALRPGCKTGEIEFSWPLISESLRNSDVLLLLVFAVIGLLLAVLLALVVPLPNDIAIALAVFS